MEFTGSLVVMDLAALVVNHANAVLVGLTEAFRVFGISLDREAVTELWTEMRSTA